ncbi:hypothetical protein [Tropicibacter sp. S64]|uniref:hypothetical protein n=1 Tax=Tropicibacter sp. S64 TaxID=3415122 RepID=UPI003C7E7082
MKTLSIAACAALFLASEASAVVTGGTLTGGAAFTAGGSFNILTGGALTGLSVGNDTFNDNNVYAFNEDQNITITTPITVDVGTSPTTGDVVASHYVFYDPPGTGGKSAIGYVLFDAMIYGVATSTTNLANSDYLINNTVTYLNPSLRGLEAGDLVWIDSGNPYRLNYDWSAGTPGDYVRVFTMESPIAAAPLPAGGLLLLGALGALAVRRRKAG